jgi:hypothetical protein
MSKKQLIPATLRNNVWIRYIGEDKRIGKCFCCGKEQISTANFDCGHVISEFNAGETKLKNLRPICRSCNSSMRTQNMEEFMKRYGLKKCKNWNGIKDEDDEDDDEEEDDEDSKNDETLEKITETIQLKSFFDQYMSNERLILNPSYQRNFCWSYKRQLLFIDSIMKNYVVPNFVICNTEDKKKYECLDGQNRLHTILNFIESKKDSKKRYLYYRQIMPNNETIYCFYNLTDDIKETMKKIKIREFNENEKDIFNNFQLSIIRIIKILNYETKSEIFNRLQNGETMDISIKIKNIEHPINSIIKKNKLLENIEFINKIETKNNSHIIFVRMIKTIDDILSNEKIELEQTNYKLLLNLDKINLKSSDDKIIKELIKFIDILELLNDEKIIESFMYVLLAVNVKINLEDILDDMINDGIITMYNNISLYKNEKGKLIGNDKLNKVYNEIIKKYTKEKTIKIEKIPELKDSEIESCFIKENKIIKLKYMTIFKKIFEEINNTERIKKTLKSNYVEGFKKYPINKIICIDETSLNPFMFIKYSRCDLGKRCVIKTNENYIFRKFTLLCAINNFKCIGYKLYNDNGMTKEKFVDFLKENIFEKYKNNLIILDNAGSHNNEYVKNAIIENRNHFLFTLPYTPKINCIEGYFN